MEKITQSSKNIIKIVIASSGFLLTFFTMKELMVYLSCPNPNYATKDTGDPEIMPKVKWTWALIINTLLVSTFALLHSALAQPEVKKLFDTYGMQDTKRSIYVICTCITLKFIIHNWVYTDWKLWELELTTNSLYWLFALVHISVWLLIYVGCICMDINELLGIKQVYYSIQHLPDPLSFKSYELQKLYSHMRHPSFIGLLIILWFVPVMRLDRFLLASLLSSYMYIVWKTDDTDLFYQTSQIEKKFN